MTNPRTRKPSAREPADHWWRGKYGGKCLNCRQAMGDHAESGECPPTKLVRGKRVLDWAKPHQLPRDAELCIFRRGHEPETLLRVARELRKLAKSGDGSLTRPSSEAASYLDEMAFRYTREARQAVKPRARAQRPARRQGSK